MSKVKVKGNASLPHLLRLITTERFVQEASNLVGRKSLLSRWSLLILSLSLLNIPRILLVYINKVSILNITKKHDNENPYDWKYKPWNVNGLRGILQPRKLTIVAISHYLKSHNCNVLCIKHTFCTSISPVLSISINLICLAPKLSLLWASEKWLRKQFLI